MVKEAVVPDFFEDDTEDATANLSARRWFAASAKAAALRGECELLRQVVQMAEDAFRAARSKLVELESLCDGG